MNEQKARQILGEAISGDNSLRSMGTIFVSWSPNDEDPSKVNIDGEVNAEQLQAIAWWISNMKTQTAGVQGAKSGKPLVLWNGRGYGCKKAGDPRWSASKSVHAFVAAYSRADASRVVEEYCGNRLPDSEIKTYWSVGAWGNSMDGITPERGLWLSFDGKPPERVV